MNCETPHWFLTLVTLVIAPHPRTEGEGTR
jgi:hypothetical protein